MEYIYILANFLSSTLIVSLATYLIQKRIDKRFNKIEDFQKTLLAIRKERYDTLLKTLQEVWEKIVETEFYIRLDLSEQVKIAQQTKSSVLTFNSKPLKDALIFIEKRALILDDHVSVQTRSLFVNYLQSTYNGYIEIIKKAQIGNASLDEVNNFIPQSLGNDYKRELSTLRKEFEKQAKKILFQDK